jgi:glutathione S-transferase
MLRVWGRVNSINVQKVMWTIGELGLPHERTDAGMAFGVVDTPEYRRMNPNGRIPTIDDNGVVLWESNAIVRYLAAKYGAGSLWPADPAQRAISDRWMDWGTIASVETLTPLFWGVVRTAPDKRNPAKIQADAEATAQKFTILEQSLDGNGFAGGPKPTIGDIVLGANLYRWFGMDVKRPSLPKVEAYYARLKTRPAFQQHVMIPIT